jgi:hypothetical protein
MGSTSTISYKKILNSLKIREPEAITVSIKV